MAVFVLTGTRCAYRALMKQSTLSKKQSKSGPILISLLLLLAGGTLGFYAGRGVYRSWTSRAWPVALGHVISSKVETLRSRRGASFKPEVEFEYSVDGHSYTSNRLAFGAVGSSNPSEAQALVRRYAKGAEVHPHYEASDPSVACLECGLVSPADYVVTLAGLALAFLGGMSLRGAVARLGRRPPVAMSPRRAA